MTDRGVDLLGTLGVDLERVDAGRRPLVRYCLDWSEQRHHLAGALGAALADRFLDLDWIWRAPASRAVTVTDAGRTQLRALLGLV